MTFVDRARDESLAGHLAANADALALSDDQREQLHLALQLEIGTWADKIRAADLAKGVMDTLKADVRSVVSAAKARGEKVVQFNDLGAMRIKSRDGLGALHDSGSLTDAELRIGMAYRYLYEQRGAGLGSQLDQHASGSGGLNAAPALALLRTYAIMRLSRAEAAVSRHDASGKTLFVLRCVAGEGQTMTAVVGKGGPRRRGLVALHEALSAVERCMSCACKAKRCLRIGVT